jgi:hypothetical protein
MLVVRDEQQERREELRCVAAELSTWGASADRALWKATLAM